MDLLFSLFVALVVDGCNTSLPGAPHSLSGTTYRSGDVSDDELLDQLDGIDSILSLGAIRHYKST